MKTIYLMLACLLLTSVAHGQTDTKADTDLDIKWKQGERLLNLVAWNVESGGNDARVIAEQMKDFASCDVVALNEGDAAFQT